MTENSNSWVTASVQEPEPAPAPEDIEAVEATGPTEPDPDIPAPDVIDRLPSRPAQSRRRGKHWYLGAHGGSGASTFAALDEKGANARGHWPQHREGQNIVIVARETVADLQAAEHAATQWRSGQVKGVTVLALITVPAHPGKLTLEVSRELKIAAGVFPRHYRADWHLDYLNHTDPNDAAPSKKDRRIIRTIQKISNKEG